MPCSLFKINSSQSGSVWKHVVRDINGFLIMNYLPSQVTASWVKETECKFTPIVLVKYKYIGL